MLCVVDDALCVAICCWLRGGGVVFVGAVLLLVVRCLLADACCLACVVWCRWLEFVVYWLLCDV